MDQEKFGKIIKDIRKKNNLTQKQLADKYNVTYQAVSKWENGINMPDMSLIKQISKDFNISLEDIFDVKVDNKKYNIFNIVIIILISILIVVGIIYIIRDNNDFKFNTLSSKCDNFNISGSIAYNDKKSSIHITNIEYCGEEKIDKYNDIECILYESIDNIDKKISSYIYKEDEYIYLDEFLKMVTLSVDDYKKSCDNYSENSLFLLINAKDDNDKIISYRIPLSLEQVCLD